MYGKLTGQTIQNISTPKIIYSCGDEIYADVDVFIVNPEGSAKTFSLCYSDKQELEEDSLIEYKRSVASNDNYRVKDLIIGPGQKLVAYSDSDKLSFTVMGKEREYNG